MTSGNAREVLTGLRGAAAFCRCCAMAAASLAGSRDVSAARPSRNGSRSWPLCNAQAVITRWELRHWKCCCNQRSILAPCPLQMAFSTLLILHDCTSEPVLCMLTYYFQDVPISSDPRIWIDEVRAMRDVVCHIHQLEGSPDTMSHVFASQKCVTCPTKSH